MKFSDLVICNKDWDESTKLIVVDYLSNGESEAVTINARAARSIFGDRPVLWFRDCVVMLL